MHVPRALATQDAAGERAGGDSLAQQHRAVDDRRAVAARALVQVHGAAGQVVAHLDRTQLEPVEVGGVTGDWMRELAAHLGQMRAAYPDDDLCVVFDIDGTIVDTDVHPPSERALRIWYTTGHSYGLHDGEWRMRGEPSEARSAIIASEPLTRDQHTWTAVPMQHLVYVRRTGDVPGIEVTPLDVE